MVIPFLSLYLTQGLDFTLAQVGWIMSAFGLGSVVGTWLGGYLTDRLGNFKVMNGSLILTGVFFILLQFITGFWMWCVSIFIMMIVVDAFRPAMFVALRAYSKPENRTRSLTLIRLAINLGFTAGPAIGGWIILVLGYTGLFWVDGVTCLVAVAVLLWALNPRRVRAEKEEEEVKDPKSAYSDGLYWVFFIGLVLFGIAFLQYFSSLPVYYKEAYQLNEAQIGLILGINGLIIFIFEMPLIKYLESKTINSLKYVLLGSILLGLSFLVLNLFDWMGILIVGMLLMTVGEMLTFPFSNAFAMQRSERGKQGQYLAMYSMSFSVANIFGHNAGMQVADRFGFELTWYMITALAVIGCLLFYWVIRKYDSEKRLITDVLEDD